jgi:putative transposase
VRKKVWKQGDRKGIRIARCTVARLITQLPLTGAVRGRDLKETTIPDGAASRPMTWSSETCRPSGRTTVGLEPVHETFEIDVNSRRIVRWGVASSSRERLVHHGDRGSQYVAIRYTERLSEASSESSVGNRGDSYDNFMPNWSSASSRRWRSGTADLGAATSHEVVEFATLEWTAGSTMVAS